MILKGQLWTFNGYVIAMQKISGDEQPSDIKPHTSHFWVRIYNLPMKLRTEEAIRMIGGTMWEVIDIDKAEVCAVGMYMRVKVVLDLMKPLKRGSSIQIDPKKAGKIFFKYERLPDLCFGCGRLGHSLKSCPEKDDDDGEDEGPHNLPCGTWLRASPTKLTMVKKEGTPEARKKLIYETTSFPGETTNTKT